MIDAQACIGCGACAENCHFGAIGCDEETGICQIDAVTTRPNVGGAMVCVEYPLGPLWCMPGWPLPKKIQVRLVTQVLVVSQPKSSKNTRKARSFVTARLEAGARLSLR